MSRSHRIYVVAVSTALALSFSSVTAAHAARDSANIGFLTSQCRWLMTEFDHAAKTAGSTANVRSAWQLRARAADECFGNDSTTYTMRDGVSDLAKALEKIGVGDGSPT